MKTWKLEIVGMEHREAAEKISPTGAYIFALFHEHIIAVTNGHAFTRPYLALASRSKDGDYAAFMLKKMQFVPVRGSSRKGKRDKGGKEAIIEFVRKLRDGTCGGLTVDGPKGPRHVCKPGAVIMAMQSGAPILPVVAIANKQWVFNSWDQFKLPKPFSRIVMMYNPPIQIEARAPSERIDEVCLEVSKSLLQLIDKTERYLESAKSSQR